MRRAETRQTHDGVYRSRRKKMLAADDAADDGGDAAAVPDDRKLGLVWRSTVITGFSFVLVSAALPSSQPQSLQRR